MDRPHVFPCSVVPFALGLHNVAVQHGSLFNDGPGDVLILNLRPEEYFCPGLSSMRSQILWALSKYVF